MSSEKTATNEISDKSVNALEDENGNVKASASYALGKLTVKTVTNEMISKLVSAPGHANQHVRARIRCVFGNMAKKVVMTEVMKKLLSALEDENENIRAGALYVLGKMGKKAATNEVISMLVSALTDENEYVRNNACEALGNISVKSLMNEIVKDLIVRFNNDHYVVSNRAAETVSNIVTSPSVLKELEPQLISDLCLSKYGSICFKNVSVEHLIDICSIGKKSECLSLVCLLALVQRSAVTAHKNKLVIYDTKEPSEIATPSFELHQQLIEAFIAEKRRLHLDVRMSGEI